MAQSKAIRTGQSADLGFEWPQYIIGTKVGFHAKNRALKNPQVWHQPPTITTWVHGLILGCVPCVKTALRNCTKPLSNLMQ
eukprot:3963267-Amphidinium_carterae.1